MKKIKKDQQVKNKLKKKSRENIQCTIYDFGIENTHCSNTCK